MKPHEYAELMDAEQDVARLVKKIMDAERLVAAGHDEYAANLPEWRRRLNGAMKRRDRARLEE